MLYPQTNECRMALALDGLWEFQIDPEGRGEADAWWQALPDPCLMAVPGSWNEVRAEYRDYLDDAWYGLTFTLPRAWTGQRLALRFGSVNYAAKVWLNGAYAGAHEGGHLPFELDVSAHVQAGRNRLTVKVNNTLQPDRVPPGNTGFGLAGLMRGFPRTNFDFFPYAGIQRPVFLCATAPTYLDWIRVETGYERNRDAARPTGWLQVEASATGKGFASAECAVLDGDATVASQILEKDADVLHGRLEIPDAELWSPASPHLYACRFTLYAADGALVDQYVLQIGLRTVKVEGSQLLLNDEPVFLKGFGKHEDFPVLGRASSLPLIAKDGALMEWIGANSYRTSHYPYAEEAMEYADRAGLLIIDEIPAVGLMFEDDADRIATRLARCRQQLADLIRRDFNHPSVIMWSVANEPMPARLMERFQGKAFDASVDQAGTDFLAALIQHGRPLDATRPFSLAGIMGGPVEWLELCDVVMINRYWGWYVHGGEMEPARTALAQELDHLHARLGKPIVLAEFGAEALAGHHSEPAEMYSEEYQVEMLRQYLEVAAERAFIAGLHIWNFADFKTGQSAMRTNAMNHKGVFTRDRRPKMAAHFLREQWRADQSGR